MSYIEIFADSSRGQYIPQYFGESVLVRCLSGVSADDLETLKAGPDAEFYWDVWASVLDNARLTDDSGHVWSIYQDGDLFIIRDDCPEHERAQLMGDA